MGAANAPESAGSGGRIGEAAAPAATPEYVRGFKDGALAASHRAESCWKCLAALIVEARHCEDGCSDDTEDFDCLVPPSIGRHVLSVVPEMLNAVRRMSDRTPTGAPTASNSRPETGPMQFPDDWPGVFVRGDHARWLAFRARTQAHLSSDEVAAQILREVADLMSSCEITNGPRCTLAQRLPTPTPEARHG